MSTLTRQNRIPDYKDYMNFVSGYNRNGKKEENSPKIAMMPTCESYSSFLENRKNRKFEPVVAPPLPSQKAPKKLVKTELYLEINQDECVDIRKTIDNFENRPPEVTETHGVGGVKSKKQLFENKSTAENPNVNRAFSNEKTNGLKKITKINTIVQSTPVKTNDERDNCNKNINKLSEILQEKMTKEQNINKLIITPHEDKLDANEVKIMKTESNVLSQNIPAPPPMPNFHENPAPPPVANFHPAPPPMPNFHENPAPVRKPVEIKQNVNKVQTTDVNKSSTERIVKKMAYSAMLDMYGAYHDKANSYVATLPKNRVKKENGLQKIIDNIAAQGGLEKLSGRSNPKQDD